MTSPIQILVNHGFESSEGVTTLAFTRTFVPQPEILEIEDMLWVIIEDKRFPERYEIHKMRCYRGPEDEDAGTGQTFVYGWVDKSSNLITNDFAGDNPDNRRVTHFLRRIIP